MLTHAWSSSCLLALLLTRLFKKLRGDSGPTGAVKDLLGVGGRDRERVEDKLGFRDMNAVREVYELVFETNR